jgi:hypothetical protein
MAHRSGDQCLALGMAILFQRITAGSMMHDVFRAGCRRGYRAHSRCRGSPPSARRWRVAPSTARNRSGNRLDLVVDEVGGSGQLPPAIGLPAQRCCLQDLHSPSQQCPCRHPQDTQSDGHAGHVCSTPVPLLTPAVAPITASPAPAHPLDDLGRFDDRTRRCHQSLCLRLDQLTQRPDSVSFTLRLCAELGRADPGYGPISVLKTQQPI